MGGRGEFRSRGPSPKDIEFLVEGGGQDKVADSQFQVSNRCQLVSEPLKPNARSIFAEISRSRSGPPPSTSAAAQPV